MHRDEDVTLLTSDQAVQDAVESSAAALGVPIRTVAHPDDALSCWPTARAILVGGDRAAALASLAPQRRERVYVVGYEPAELGSWSLPLGAEVIPLPQGREWLSSVLAPEVEHQAPTIAVVGGSGGAGASTLAAGLALAGARTGVRCALIDADALGGGVDLVLGAERVPGWRWSRLLAARGEVGDLRGVLPRVAGVTVVSFGREACPLRAEALNAVVGALARHHDALIVDAGRGGATAAMPLVRGADAAVLAVRGQVRAIAAAAIVREHLGAGAVGVVVGDRAGPPGTLVAEMVGAPLWGRLPRSRAVAADADAGELPRHRGAWARATARVWTRVWTEACDGR
ncbi:MAG: hypothetical protein IPL36_02835 [Nigerium sp.]|nr:hypothetical protein [Nigerium sp.]